MTNVRLDRDKIQASKEREVVVVIICASMATAARGKDGEVCGRNSGEFDQMLLMLLKMEVG